MPALTREGKFMAMRMDPAAGPVASPVQAPEPLLSPIERVSEMCFGLFMAITFAGAMSVATPRGGEVRTMVIAALGCNLAWGLVDAVMYLVRTLTERGRALSQAAAPSRPVERPHLSSRDALAAVAIFAIVVAATFPVVLPFVLITDPGTAKTVSRVVALTMLFMGGLSLGRHAGATGLATGFSMMGLGAALVVAIMALGG